MTKEKIKTFVKDHKREIIIIATAIAGTACAIIGIKKIKICSSQIKSYKDEIGRLNQFNKSLCEATSGCSKYVPVRYDEVCRAAANGYLEKNRWIDPEGNIMEIKNFIAFGNNVKEKI